MCFFLSLPAYFYSMVPIAYEATIISLNRSRKWYHLLEDAIIYCIKCKIKKMIIIEMFVRLQRLITNCRMSLRKLLFFSFLRTFQIFSLSLSLSLFLAYTHTHQSFKHAKKMYDTHYPLFLHFFKYFMSH